MNNTSNPAPFNDEIDLKASIKKIINVIGKGAKKILYSIFFGGFIGICIGLFFFIKPTYQSTMVISSDILVLSNIQALFEPFEDLIEDDDTLVLAERLNVDPSDAAKLKKLEVEDVFDGENPSYCEIIASVTDNSVLPQLQDGILAFLENNEFVKRRVAIREAKYNVLIDKIDKDIRGIDSLKTRVQGNSLFGSSSSGSNILMMEPANLFRVSLEMAEKRQDLLGQLDLNESIELFRGFTPSSKPSSPSWIICLVTGLAGGLIIGFAILFFKEMDRYVRS